MRRLVLGTAGHIDHGKTALVRALTGTDTDRLPEEKRRGMTIDLGFAELPLSPELSLSIVDVPGHEAFVRNMVAGATGIDLVLFVIAADEGVMPQTREHLAIIDLLGIGRGVVALTRTDLVEEDWLELVREEVADLLQQSALATAPVVAVSARTGDGIDALTDALHATARDAGERRYDDVFRMPADRVFTVHGTGTVVTGTVWSGTLHRDQQVRLLPAGITARVRGLQQHGSPCDRIAAGSRAAIALTGVDRASVGRGDAVIDGDGWAAASILTAEVTVLPDAESPLRPRQRVRIHLGTAEVVGRLALVSTPLQPGARAILQLRLEQPMLARAGDRFVIRSWSPAHTIAGGTVLEPHAPRRKRLDAAATFALRQLASPDTALTGAVALAGATGIDRAAAPILSGLPIRAVDAALADATAFRCTGGRILAAAAVDAARDRIVELITAFHASEPLGDGPEREMLRRDLADRGDPVFELAISDLIEQGVLAAAGNAVALASHQPAPSASQVAPLRVITGIFATAGLLPPELHELPQEITARPDLPLLLRHLERTGQLVRLTPTRWCDAGAVASAAARLRTALGTTPHPVAAFKDTLGLTRKHLMPLLEFLDRAGVSHRDGDLRTLAATEKP